MNTLGSILRAQDEDLQAIKALPALPHDDFDDEILTGKITQTLRNNNSFEEFCGFSEGVITALRSW